jgi:lipopolysaccharide transport system permease protein
LVFCTYFAGVVSQAGQSLTSNSNLVTKVYFTRIALPASSAVSGLFDLAVSSAFIVVLMAYYRISPGWPALMAPVFLIGLVLFTIGVGLLIAAMTVSYRDVKYTLPLLIQLWMFATPVIYPASFLPEQIRPFLFLNPLAGLVEGFRNCLVSNRWPDPTLTGISLIVATAMFAFGWAYFTRASRAFADVI